MATRKTYSDEQKRELIEKYKSDYVSSSRSSIKGQKITAEIFDALHKDMKWHRIYMNYVRKYESKEKDFSFTEKIKIPYGKIRAALNIIESSMDEMTENQIKRTFDSFEKIRSYYADKKQREQNQKVKELESKEAILREQLEKILAAKDRLREM